MFTITRADSLPHNGAVITLLAVAGLTHKQSYEDIFAITLIKTAAVFAIIASTTRPASCEHSPRANRRPRTNGRNRYVER